MSASAPTRLVLDTIRRSLGGAWACIEEVEQIDLLAVGIWRSTGHRTRGFEVKVTRSDWLRELRKPGKAQAHRVDAWTVATLPGVVKAGEVPAGWGLAEVHEQGAGHCLRTLIPPRWARTARGALTEFVSRNGARHAGIGMAGGRGTLDVTIARRAAYAEADARALVKNWPGTTAQLERAFTEAQVATGRMQPGIGVYGQPGGPR